MRRRCSKSAECAERAPQRERRRAWRAPVLPPVCGGCGSGRACLRGSSELCCCHMELSGSATAAAATAATSSIWETMLGDLLMSAGCSVALCMLHSTRAVGERERWGAHEEHSHVARASTRLFLSRSRLDRSHSCTHSTHVLALVETFAWWTFGMFLALACERAGLCGRKRVCQDRRGCSSSWAECQSRYRLLTVPVDEPCRLAGFTRFDAG
jgi:hypothetical protein